MGKATREACASQSLSGEFLFDQAVQMTTNRRMIEALDHFVEESGDEKTLGNFCGDASGAQIEEFIFVGLSGSRAMGATDIVGQDFETGHRVRFGIVAEEKVTNLLIRVGEMSVRFHADEPAKNGAGAIVERIAAALSSAQATGLSAPT